MLVSMSIYSVPISSDGLIFVHKGIVLAKIRALDGQNSSFARLLLRSAAPLRVQSVIELPKQLTDALTVH